MYPILSIIFFHRDDVQIAEDNITDIDERHHLLNPDNGELDLF